MAWAADVNGDERPPGVIGYGEDLLTLYQLACALPF
jgi:hypothetical protein